MRGEVTRSLFKVRPQAINSHVHYQEQRQGLHVRGLERPYARWAWLLNSAKPPSRLSPTGRSHSTKNGQLRSTRGVCAKNMQAGELGVHQGCTLPEVACGGARREGQGNMQAGELGVHQGCIRGAPRVRSSQQRGDRETLAAAPFSTLFRHRAPQGNAGREALGFVRSGAAARSSTLPSLPFAAPLLPPGPTVG